jgi:transglutaminase-like putative cysteine protease
MLSPAFRRLFLSRSFAILLLLLLAIGAVAVGLAGTPRLRQSAPWLLNAAMLSTLVGWLLAAAPLPGQLSLPVGAVLGAAWAFITGGNLVPALLNGLSKLPPLLPQIVRHWLEPASPPNWQPVNIAAQLLAADAAAAWQRLLDWLAIIVKRQPASDSLPLAIFWIGVVWLLALWAGWATRRTCNALAALGPAVGLLAALLNYQGLPATTLITPLGATLLLMALLRYDRREAQWTQQRMDFAEGMGMDVTLMAGALVALLLTAGVLAPSFSVEAVVNFVRQFNRPANAPAAPMGESFGLQAKPPPAAPRKVRPAGLASSHALRGRPNLTTDVVMTVEVIQPRYNPPPEYLPPPQIMAAAPRYYWRMLTYDVYTGSGWRSSKASSIGYAAETGLFATQPNFQQTILQQITPVQELGGVLFVTGQLQSANQPYEAAWRVAPGAFTQADLFGALIADQTYQAASYLPQVSAAQLRSAPTTYPEQIALRYRQLPENLPIRVRELALTLTTDQPSAYDKAAALEGFLRTIPYTLDIASPPRDRDVVDYFLFDLQTGYCDYYASALAVLGRSVGLPTRLVMGYASGSFDPTSQRYVVRETDAHAWVEIYFPEIGWVEFEPTAAQPAFIRPDTDGKPLAFPKVELPQPTVQPAPSLAARLQGALTLALFSLACLGALAVQGVFLWRAVEMWWWSRLQPRQAVIAIYQQMRRQGERLLGPLPGGDTPAEFAGRLQMHLSHPHDTPGRWRKRLSAWFARRLTPASAEIEQLTGHYTQAMYSDHAIETPARTLALETWRRLRRRLWLAQWAQWVNHALRPGRTTP